MALGAFAPMPLRLGGNSLEGLTATQHARICADLAAAKRMAPFGIWTFTKSGTDITIHSYYGQNGVGSAFEPIGTGFTAGLSAWGWTDRSFVDPYGIRQSFKARTCTVTPHGSTAATGSGYLLFDFLGVQVVVNTFDADGAGLDCKATVVIW